LSDTDTGLPSLEAHAEEGVIGPDGARWSLRMKDLCEASGLQRQAIHFYVKEGLLPPGSKSSRNMAWYGETHLSRLLLIKRLQHERFLPLRAIKAVLSEQDGQFSRDQQVFIREVKRHTRGTLRGGPIERVPVAALCADTGVAPTEAEALDRIGLAPIVSIDGTAVISAHDVWVYETLAELRALGFTEEAGFGVDELGLYEEAISSLFEREKDLLASRLTRFSADRAAVMVERVLPIIHRFLERYHDAKIRRFFSAWE
jgi:DNA-binding transcriptional MerR regulator